MTCTTRARLEFLVYFERELDRLICSPGVRDEDVNEKATRVACLFKFCVISRALKQARWEAIRMGSWNR